MKAYPTANFNRVNTGIHCTREITLEEIKAFIRR